MPKITLNKEMFKALASDTRLDILKTLDGKKMGLNDISKATNLNKATLYEHLTKLNEAGLVKRNEREGHKWVYYKLTWKGSSLLHPENTRIVVLFSLTILTLFFGIIGIFNFLKDYVNIDRGSDMLYSPQKESMNDSLFLNGQESIFINNNPIFLYIAIIFLSIFCILSIITIWRYKKNRSPKL